LDPLVEIFQKKINIDDYLERGAVK
jgi:hypothetical protein